MGRAVRSGDHRGAGQRRRRGRVGQRVDPDRVLGLSADRGRYDDLRARALARAVELAWPEVGRRQAAFYERATLRPTGRPLRPDRVASEREFGPPVQVAGGGRPSALPVLREDTRVSRALGKGLDLLAQLLPAVREEK